MPPAMQLATKAASAVAPQQRVHLENTPKGVNKRLVGGWAQDRIEIRQVAPSSWNIVERSRFFFHA